MLIAWNTVGLGNSVVEYGLTPDFGLVASSTSAVVEHAVILQGLSPGTTYFYSVKTAGVTLDAGSFQTNPLPANGGFSFVAWGDSGTGDERQMAVSTRIEALQPDLGIITGDVVYPAGEGNDFDPKFFTPYRNIISRICVFPSLGNHDVRTDLGAPYLAAFYLPHNNPENSERYYSFDFGDAHFIAMDTNSPYGQGSAQYDWLQNDLASTTKPWKFVFMHHQPYDTSGSPSPNLSLRQALGPLFEQYGVDIVFSGHAHRYTRSVPVSEFYPSSKGVVYIVSGGGGAALHPTGEWAPETAYAESTYHVVSVNIANGTLRLEATKPDGQVFDRLVIEKGK
ncbi:MAG: metallophosphoesterase family protein [Chloroflexi bacterium]|nr:metallophosphoesterase family protein [Chloroflexota bacterium]